MEEIKSKIQLRAEILKKLNQIKLELNNGDFNIHKVLGYFENIDDYKTLSNTIIREISSKKSQFDYVLSQILVNVLSRNCEGHLFDAIMSDKYDKLKRVHLVNILSEINPNADYMALLDSILGNDEIDEIEDTILNELPLSPSYQIDFLDFYMQCKQDEKESFLKSILNETCKEDWVHIYSLLIYARNELTPYIIDEIVKTRSQFAFYPLYHALNVYNDKKIKLKAKNAINKLKLMNIACDIKRHIAYKDLLSSSKIILCKVSPKDEHGNFALSFLRKTDNNLYIIFFAVINIKGGVLECIGFDDLEEIELKDTFYKMYKRDKTIELEERFASSLLEYAIQRGEKNNIKSCYEVYPWRYYTFDIEVYDEETFKEMEEKWLKEF